MDRRTGARESANEILGSWRRYTSGPSLLLARFGEMAFRNPWQGPPSHCLAEQRTAALFQRPFTDAHRERLDDWLRKPAAGTVNTLAQFLSEPAGRFLHHVCAFCRWEVLPPVVSNFHPLSCAFAQADFSVGKFLIAEENCRLATVGSRHGKRTERTQGYLCPPSVHAASATSATSETSSTSSSFRFQPVFSSSAHAASPFWSQLSFGPPPLRQF